MVFKQTAMIRKQRLQTLLTHKYSFTVDYFFLLVNIFEKLLL